MFNLNNKKRGIKLIVILLTFISEIYCVNYGTIYHQGSGFNDNSSIASTQDFNTIVMGANTNLGNVYLNTNASISLTAQLSGGFIGYCRGMDISADGKTIVQIISNDILIYKLTGVQYTVYETITMVSPTQIKLLYNSQQFAVMSSSTLVIYKFNSTNYELKTSISALTVNALAATSYPRYFALIDDTNKNLTVYKYLQRRVIVQYISHNQPNSSFTCVSMTDTLLSLKHGIATGSSDGVLRYYELGEDISIVLIQQINLNTSITQIKLTKSGKYMLVGLANGKVDIYINNNINTTNTSYTLLQSLLGSNTSIKSLILSDQGEFVYTGDSSGKLMIYYECNVANCLGCSWRNKCSTCNTTFQLINSSCSCFSNQTLNTSGLCADCNVPNCQRCDSNNTCALCKNNLTVLNNSCVCPTNSTISTVTNICLNCTVLNCYRCDFSNICSQCNDGYTLLANNTCTCSQPRTISLSTGQCVLCNLTYCILCNQSGVCAQCLTGFSLVNGGCQCSVSKTINSSFSCVNCIVSYCLKCETSNVCSVCRNGFAVSGNSCSCTFGKTISFIDNNCYSCNVNGCLRCDTLNFCALCKNGYSLLSTGNCLCEAGKTVSEKTSYCVLCNQVNCLICDYANICAKCAQGYNIDSLGSCRQLSRILWSDVLLVISFILVMLTIGTLIYLLYKQNKTERQIKSLSGLEILKLKNIETIEQIQKSSHQYLQEIENNKVAKQESKRRKNASSLSTLQQKQYKNTRKVNDFIPQEQNDETLEVIQFKNQQKLRINSNESKDKINNRKKRSRIPPIDVYSNVEELTIKKHEL